MAFQKIGEGRERKKNNRDQLIKKIHNQKNFHKAVKG